MSISLLSAAIDVRRHVVVTLEQSAHLALIPRIPDRNPRGPFSNAERHHGPGLIDKLVSGIRAIIHDISLGRAHPFRQPVVTHELPYVFLWVAGRGTSRAAARC